MARARPAPALLYDVYVDESSHTKHKYLILGGLGLPTESVPTLISRIQCARLPGLPAGEMAWIKVSRAKLESYRRAVDLFVEGAQELGMTFHSLVVDTHILDHSRYNQGSREIGFNKEIYQLAMKFRRSETAKLFHFYLDFRNTSNDTEELRFILNSGAKKSGDPRDWPFRRMHFRNSAGCQALQLVDILLGGIAYHLNGHRKSPDASPAKCSLSDYILEKNKVRDVFQDTPKSAQFTIWHRQLRK